MILMFDNEVQAKKWKKETGIKVPKSNILMTLTEGNKKLKNTSLVSFYQWNILAVVTCPYRTQLCEKSCYAIKAERIYPTVRVRRSMNYEFSKTERFVPAMIEQIEYELQRKKNAGKTIFFRIHESGDFYNYEYLKKWHMIASHFKGNKRIVFMAYTKSLPFVKLLHKEFGKENVNIVFKASEWDDTKQKFREMRHKLGLSVFTAYPKNAIPKGFVTCPSMKGVNCGTCGLCYRQNSPNIAIEIH